MHNIKEEFAMLKTTFFTTIENQVRTDGSRGLLYDHFDDENAALAKYYTICAAAAVSEIPYHAAYILNSEGYVAEQRIFDRRENATDPDAQA